MKSRSFSAALFAAFVLVSFSIPSAMAGNQPTPGQCYHARDMRMMYGGAQRPIPKNIRVTLERCQALEKERKAAAAKHPLPVQSLGIAGIFR